jgi:hypothetical protein
MLCQFQYGASFPALNSGFGQGQAITTVIGSYRRALWIFGAGLPETSICCFRVSPLASFLALDFFSIESLKYRQLTYGTLAKVDSLFSPSYTKKTFASLLFIIPCSLKALMY